MKKWLIIYLLFAMGVFFGLTILPLIIMYRIWTVGSFVFYEDKIITLLLETVFIIIIFPAIFILIWYIIEGLE